MLVCVCVCVCIVISKKSKYHMANETDIEGCVRDRTKVKRFDVNVDDRLTKRLQSKIKIS